MKVSHISPSAANMAMKCGQQYMFRYKMGMKIAPGFAQIRGRAAHRGVEHNLAQKIESKKDLAATEVMQAASDAVDDAFHGEVKLDGDYEELGYDKAKDVVKDEATTLSALHLERVAPAIQPTAVEVRIEMPESGTLPVKVLGVIDVIDDAGVIHDTKTARKSGRQDMADGSDQLTWYALLYRARYGKAPKELVLDQLVQTRTGKVSVNRFATQRNFYDLQAVIGIAKHVLKMAESEIFLPAPDSAWWCSAKWCGYHPDAGGPCPYGRRENRPTT